VVNPGRATFQCSGRAQEANDEAHLPAEPAEASEATRMAPEDVRSRGSRDHQESSPEGAAPPVGLIWRLRGRRSFQELRRRGVRRRGSKLALTWLDDGSAPPRVGYAIGRKVGRAVDRSRLRRRLQAIVPALASEGRVPAGLLLVGVIDRAACDASTGELREELCELLMMIQTGRRG
jgi:ribonuclease P protein component